MLAIVMPQRVRACDFVRAAVDRAISKCCGSAMHAHVRILEASTGDFVASGPHVAYEHVASQAREHRQDIKHDDIQVSIIKDRWDHGCREIVFSDDTAIGLHSFAIEGLCRLHQAQRQRCPANSAGVAIQYGCKTRRATEA